MVCSSDFAERGTAKAWSPRLTVLWQAERQRGDRALRTRAHYAGLDQQVILRLRRYRVRNNKHGMCCYPGGCMKRRAMARIIVGTVAAQTIA
jgi:hypothetical protein